MQVVKIIALVVGCLMMAMGVLWMGQGLNIIRWPENNFMIGLSQWIWRGAALAAVGGGLV